MRQFKVSQRVLEKLRQMPFGHEWSETEFSQQLADQIPDLGVAARGEILEAAAIAAITPRLGTRWYACWCVMMPTVSSGNR